MQNKDSSGNPHLMVARSLFEVNVALQLGSHEWTHMFPGPGYFRYLNEAANPLIADAKGNE